jgi:uncharacterized protein YbdZ (MbtH family)
MSTNDPEDATVYKIVANCEEQYAIWPEHKEIPHGWKQVGKTGLKSECRAWIKEVWIDMRPLSLRNKMDDFANSAPAPRYEMDQRQRRSPVEALCEGDSPVEIDLRSDSTAKALREAIDRGYVHVRFTQTAGGTTLGFRLNRETSDFSAADIENRTGSVHLEGNLTLDYVRVKCVANIDLENLKGKGHLTRIEVKEISVA